MKIALNDGFMNSALFQTYLTFLIAALQVWFLYKVVILQSIKLAKDSLYVMKVIPLDVLSENKYSVNIMFK